MAKILQNINGKLVPVTTIAQITGGGGGISEERVITLIQEQLAQITHTTWVGSTDIDPGEGSPAPDDCPENGLIITDVDDSDDSNRLVMIIRQVVEGMLAEYQPPVVEVPQVETKPWVDYSYTDPDEGTLAGNLADKGLLIVGDAHDDSFQLDQRIKEVIEAMGGVGGGTTVVEGLTEEDVDAKIAAIEHPAWIARQETPGEIPANLANGGLVLAGDQVQGMKLDDRIKQIMGQLRYSIISNTPPGKTAPDNLMNGGFYIYQE